MTTTTDRDTEYPLRTADLATEFNCSVKSIRAKAKVLGLGIDFGGRAGYRYSAADRRKLIESLRPDAPVKPRRSRRRSP